MNKKDPIKFIPCIDKNCHFFKEYTLKRDARGGVYGIEHDGDSSALNLCNQCKRAVKKDFFFDIKAPVEEEA